VLHHPGAGYKHHSVASRQAVTQLAADTMANWGPHENGSTDVPYNGYGRLVMRLHLQSCLTAPRTPAAKQTSCMHTTAKPGSLSVHGQCETGSAEPRTIPRHVHVISCASVCCNYSPRTTMFVRLKPDNCCRQQGCGQHTHLSNRYAGLPMHVCVCVARHSKRDLFPPNCRA
jgi:hypothetical protein